MRTRLGLVLAIAAAILISGAAAAQAAWWPLHGEIDHGSDGSGGHWAPSLTNPTVHDGYIVYERPDIHGMYVDEAGGGAGWMVRYPTGYDQLISRASLDGTRVVYTARQSDGGKTDILMWDRDNPDASQVRLSDDAEVDALPVISGDHVAWLKMNDGDFDVWLYDLDTGTGEFIAPGFTGNTDLVMDGDHIAWAAFMGDNYNIVLYDMETDVAMQYTYSGYDERYPALDGDMIAFSLKSNIVDFDLQMQPIHGNPAVDGKYISWAEGDQIRATISGDIIAWQDSRTGDWDVRAAAFSDPIPNYSSQVIANGPRDQTAPSASGSTIVWVDQYDDALHTTVMDLTIAGSTRVTLGFNTLNPAYGKSVTLTPRLLNGVNDSLLKSARLYSGASATGPWTFVRSVQTGSSYAVRPTRPTYYRVIFSGDVFNAPSEAVSDLVVQKCSLSAPRVSTTSVRAGKTYTWSGDLRPRHGSGIKTVTLRFYHKEGTAWVLRRTAAAVNYNYSSYSRFRVATSLSQKGSWRTQAYAPADALHAATTGAWKYFTVR